MQIINHNNLYPVNKTYVKSSSFYCPKGISFGSKLNADTLECTLKIGQEAKSKYKELGTIVNSKNSAITTSVKPDITETLNKFQRFNIAEYKSLSEQEKEVLRQEYSKVIKEEEPICDSQTEKLHDIVSGDIKTCLDKKYGEDNYKVIIIGRSLSSVGKVLGYKIGEENVINLPMSGAEKYLDKEVISQCKKDGQISKYSEFIKQYGLEKEKIEQSDKKYIIMDYCNTGDSLKGATTLLTQPELLGNKNIKSMDVLDCINNYTVKNVFETELRYSKYKDLSFVNNAYNLPEASSAVKTMSDVDKTTKLAWFKLLDNQMTKPKTQVSVQQNNKISIYSAFVQYFKSFFPKSVS